jgi:hypothetical protein
VSERGPLRVVPALAGEPSAELAPGDVARTVQRRGLWTRVRLAGGRDGWVETDRLIPLGGSEGGEGMPLLLRPTPAR